jgi:hypothetical protein
MRRLPSDAIPRLLQACIKKNKLENMVVVYAGTSAGLRPGANMTPGVAPQHYAYEIFVTAVSLPCKKQKKRTTFVSAHGPRAAAWKKAKPATSSARATYVAIVYDPDSNEPVACTLPDLVAAMASWKGRGQSAVQTTAMVAPQMPAATAFALLRYAVSKHAVDKDALERMLAAYCFKSPRNRLELTNSMLGERTIKSFFAASHHVVPPSHDVWSYGLPTVWPDGVASTTFAVLADGPLSLQQLQELFDLPIATIRAKSPAVTYVTVKSSGPSANKALGRSKIFFPATQFFHADVFCKRDAEFELFALLSTADNASVGSFLLWTKGGCGAGGMTAGVKPGALSVSVVVSANPVALRHYTPGKHAPAIEAAVAELQAGVPGDACAALHMRLGVGGGWAVSAKVYLWTASVRKASAAWLSSASLIAAFKAARHSGKLAVIEGAIWVHDWAVLAALFPAALSSRMRAPAHLNWLLKYAATFDSGRHWLAKAKRVVQQRIAAAKKKMANLDVHLPPCLWATVYPNYQLQGHPNYRARATSKLVLRALMQVLGLAGSDMTPLGISYDTVLSSYTAGGKKKSGEELIADLKRNTAAGAQSGTARCSTMANHTAMCPYSGDNGLCAASRGVNDFNGTVLGACTSGKVRSSGCADRRQSVSLAM